MRRKCLSSSTPHILFINSESYMPGRVSSEIYESVHTNGYRHASLSRHSAVDSSPQVESNELLPDSIRPLVLELTSFLTLATRGPPTLNYAYRDLQSPKLMPPLQAIYHSIRLSERIPIRVSPTLADACLASYNSFQSTDSYRHATASSPIPCDSSRRVDSNELLPDSIRPLAIELSLSLRMSFPGG